MYMTHALLIHNYRRSVELSLTVREEKDYSFQLKCKVKRKATPLFLRVTAEGYSINLGLCYLSPDGSELKLPIGKSDNRKIDFGEIQVNDNVLGEISVVNHSLYSFEYHWFISNPGHHGTGKVVTIQPEAGEVSAGGKVCSQLMFNPTKKMTLRNCQLTLRVRIRNKW